MSDFGPEFHRPIEVPPVIDTTTAPPDAGPVSPYDLVPPEERLTGQGYDHDPEGLLRDTAQSAADNRFVVTDQTYDGGPTNEELAGDGTQSTASTNGQPQPDGTEHSKWSFDDFEREYRDPDPTDTNQNTADTTSNGNAEPDPNQSYDYLDEEDLRNIDDGTYQGSRALATRGSGEIDRGKLDLRSLSDAELRALLTNDQYNFYRFLKDVFGGKVTMDQVQANKSEEPSTSAPQGGELVPAASQESPPIPPTRPTREEEPQGKEMVPHEPTDNDAETKKAKPSTAPMGEEEILEGLKDRKKNQEQNDTDDEAQTPELEPAAAQTTDTKPANTENTEKPVTEPDTKTTETQEPEAATPAPEPEGPAVQPPTATQEEQKPEKSRPFTPEETLAANQPTNTTAEVPRQTEQPPEPAAATTEADPTGTRPAQWEGGGDAGEWVKMGPLGATGDGNNTNVEYLPPDTEATTGAPQTDTPSGDQGRPGPNFGPGIDPSYAQFVREAAQQLVDGGVDPSVFPPEVQDLLNPPMAAGAEAGAGFQGDAAGTTDAGIGEGGPEAPGPQFPPRPNGGPRRTKPVGPRQQGRTGAGPTRTSTARTNSTPSTPPPPPRPTPGRAPNGEKYRTGSRSEKAREDQEARKSGTKATDRGRDTTEARYRKAQQRRKLQKLHAEKMATLVPSVGRRLAGAVGSVGLGIVATPGNALLRISSLLPKGTIDNKDGTISVRVKVNGQKTYVKVTAKSKTMARLKAHWQATRQDVWGASK